MIKNDRQYRITVAEARRFEAALAGLRSAASASEWSDVEALAVESQLESLRKEIADYEHLVSGAQRTIEIKSFSELPTGLIQARIASGMSQRELAEKMGLKPQMIQRYEASDYAGASFTRLREVADALRLQIRQHIDLASPDPDRDELIGRLRDAGIATQLLDRRILPAQGAATGDLAAMDVARRIFEPESGDSGGKPLPAAAGFKVPGRVSASYLDGYVRYTAYLCHLVIRATPEMRRPLELPSSSAGLRSELLGGSEGTLDFGSLVRWLLRRGVAVLPLADPGAFHGAFWRMSDRDVIVLKQTNRSPSRWLFDLLHEYFHLLRTNEAGGLVVDAEDSAQAAGTDADEEQRANRFAGEVLLGGDPEELASEAVAAAGGKLERLKRSVPVVADSYGVNAADLANYLAWRLAMQGENWWGAASNLQPAEPDPWLVARDELLLHLDLSHLDAVDQSILARALEEAP